MFADAGVTIPKTYAEFTAAAKQFTTGDQFGYVDGWAPLYLFPKWCVWYHLNGGDLYGSERRGPLQRPDRDQGHPGHDRPAAVHAEGGHRVAVGHLRRRGEEGLPRRQGRDDDRLPAHLVRVARPESLGSSARTRSRSRSSPATAETCPHPAASRRGVLRHPQDEPVQGGGARPHQASTRTPRPSSGCSTRREELHDLRSRGRERLPVVHLSVRATRTIPAADQASSSTTFAQPGVQGQSRTAPGPAYQKISDDRRGRGVRGVPSARIRQAEHKKAQDEIDAYLAANPGF